MQQSRELRTVSDSFLDIARRTSPDAPIASRIWPTAGQMIDHLGTIQRWATAIIRTGVTADESDHERPPGRDPLKWFAAGADALVDTVEAASPDAPCWTFVGPGRTSFWGRRMVHEATKHLWDLRTAHEAAPSLPPEIAPGTAAAIVDEFDEVFIARARRRGIGHLPGSVLLRSRNGESSWLIDADWQVHRDPPDPDPSAVLTASTEDLALVLWERADPWRLPHRFIRSGDDGAIRALCTTPVHL